MAYEIGTATSPEDLLDKIRVVALARGWEVTNDTDPSPTTHWLGLRLGTAYFNLLSDSETGADVSDLGPYIYGLQATGYDNLLVWSNQPGSSYLGDSPDMSRCKANRLQGPYTSYRIFSGANYIHTVIETAPNVFTHIALGRLNKYGTYEGGEYMSMSSWYYDSSGTQNYPDSGEQGYLFDNWQGTYSRHNNPTILRVDIDAKNYFWNSQPVDANITTSRRRVTGIIRGPFNNGIDLVSTPNTQNMQHTPNAFNLISPLLPSILNVERESELYSPVGDVPDLRVVNMERYNAGDIITLGSDEWVIIPAKSKTLTWNNIPPSLAPSSANYGYAYKKVT